MYLRPDDIVKFVRVYNPQKQQHQARRLHRIQEAPIASQLTSPSASLENRGSCKVQLVSSVSLEKVATTVERANSAPTSARVCSLSQHIFCPSARCMLGWVTHGRAGVLLLNIVTLLQLDWPLESRKQLARRMFTTEGGVLCGCL